MPLQPHLGHTPCKYVSEAWAGLWPSLHTDFFRWILVPVLIVFFFTGCGKGEIKDNQTPKECCFPFQRNRGSLGLFPKNVGSLFSVNITTHFSHHQGHLQGPSFRKQRESAIDTKYEAVLPSMVSLDLGLFKCCWVVLF